MKCKKCEWSWEIETDDMNPYLCHKCGFDDKLNDYDLISLIFVLEHMHDPQAMLTKVHANLSKKSMIIISDAVDFDKVPNYLNVVPSVLEAHDMIEMDEIERDLGF